MTVNHDEALADENWEGWSTRPNRWLHIPPQLTARLAEASVNADTFQLYIKEVLSVFPLDWADDFVNSERSTTGDIAQEPLWPSHDTFYTQHPAPRFVSGIMLGRDGVLDLARLGRDLYDTKNLSGVQSVRRELRHVDQYSARIFELVVLAAFARAGFCPELIGTPDCLIAVEGSSFLVEIVHRGQPFARHLGNRIWHSLGLHTLKADSVIRGAITVTLQPGAGGAGEDAYELGDKIARHIVEASIIRDSMYIWYERCLIHYDPRAAETSLRVSSGNPLDGDESHSSVVDRIAYNVLKSKIRQLTRPGDKAARSLIAVNFGPLFRGIPNYLKAFPDSSTIKQHERDRESLIGACMRFLRDYPIVSGVLIWWEQWPLDLDARAMVFGPHPISLVVPSREIEAKDDGLAGLLRAGKLLQ
jgi:hypothetical protein